MFDAAVPATITDFHRHVYCVLGLPFDAHTLALARQHLVQAVAERKRCVIITPNVNFVAACQRDPAFRDLLLKSDMSLVDGMPIFGLARLLALPIPERVPGSSLFEALSKRRTDKPISVYLFGDAPGVAKVASQEIQNNAVGIKSAGWFEPQFAPIEALSEAPIIDEINRSSADFLVLALGAQKGQRWIDLNAHRLNVPAICHLGAVIKMTAGVVSRAPAWVQQLGLEWLWRIKEEPFLWNRYRGDAIILAKLFLTRVMPYVGFRLWRRLTMVRGLPACFSVTARPGAQLMKLSGHWRELDSEVFRVALTRVAQAGDDIELDLSELSYLDSSMVGLFLLIRGHCLRSGAKMHVRAVSPSAQRLFRYFCAEFLLEPVQGSERVKQAAAAKSFSLSGNDAEFAD